MRDQSRKDSVEYRTRWPPPTKKMLARHEKMVPTLFNILKGARTICNQNYTVCSHNSRSHQNRRKFPYVADATFGLSGTKEIWRGRM